MPLPKTPKVKVPPLSIAAPDVMTRSSITDLANRVRQSEGQYGAQRVERAADEIPNLEKLYQEQALMRAFTGDNAQALMTMKPSDFERYAAPLDANLSDRSLQKIADITGFHNNGGFSDVPYLNINKMKQGSTGLPYISGHEGRHRSRVMDAAGEQAGLVQLVPRSELREPFPRRSKEEYLEALYKEMQLTGNRVKPEAYYLDPRDDKTYQRRAIELPDFYAQGGIVDSAPEEAIKNTIKDPQAFRMLDMDLANLALMNQKQPQRMAGGGKLRVMHGSTTKITPDVARSFDVTSDPAYALKRAGDKMDALNIQGPPVLNKFDVPEDKLLRMDETPYSAEQVNAMRKFWSKLPADTNMTGEQIYDLMTQNRQHYDTLMPGITKAADFAGYQRPATGTGGRDDWFRITNPEHIEMVKRMGGAVHKAEGGIIDGHPIFQTAQVPFAEYRHGIGMAEGGHVNIESGIDINREYNPFSVLEKPTYGSDVPSTIPTIDQQRYELTMKGRQEAENRRYRAQQGDALAGVDPTGTLAVADAARTMGLGMAAVPVHAGRVGLHYLQHGNLKDAPTGHDYEELMSPRTAEGAELLQEAGTIGSRLTGSEMGFGMHPNLWVHNPPTVAQMRAGLKLGAERAAPALSKIDQAVRSGYESGAIPQPGLSIKDVTPRVLAPANEQTPVVVPKETKAKSKIPEGEELIAHHNLSPAKLFGADSLGGMPVPSLAISKASEPMTNFGEITLIAPSSLAEPSAKNPVFRSDAYTATKPNITFSIDTKSENNLKNLLSNTIKNIPDGNHEFYRVVDDIKELEYNPLIRSKFLEEKGVLPNKNDFAHKYDFSRAVNEIINENKNEYESWLDNFQASLPDNGVDIKERIFKGYTNMGNRRYVDANLENFVKEMKGINNRQSFFGSPAYLRAVATPKFKNFKEVKSERSRIVSAEDFETSKKETDEKFEGLNKKLREISGYDSRDALAEVAETKNPNVLDRIYGEGNVSSELKKEIVSFVNKLKSLPTGYFEAKPQRAVGLSEFAGAIIPKNSTDKVRAILKKNGITDIHEYSTPEERMSLFKKYGKHMFSAAPVAVGAGLNEVTESQEDPNNMKRGGKISFAPNVDAMRHELTRSK